MKKYASIIGATFLILSFNSMANVKYADLSEGDSLYTRGTSENCRTGWISFKVKSIKNGVAWGYSKEPGRVGATT